MRFHIISIFFFVFFACTNKVPKETAEYLPKLEKQKSPVSSSIRGISVVDSNIIWLSGEKGSILKTIDAGQHWKRLKAPDEDSLDYRSIHAFNSSQAIIVSAGFPARVYKTETSGKNWELVYENLDSAAFMNSIAFKNGREGVIIGDQLGGRHLVLITKDGGNSWLKIDSLGLPLPLKNENGFAASGSCIAIKDNQYFIGLGGGYSRVFYSNDGANWNATESKLKTDKPSSGIYSIAVGKDYLMAVGGDYTEVDSMHHAAISQNGEDWIAAKGKLSGYRSVVDYSEKCNCWLAAGTNGVEVSYDNGGSWEKISDQDINTLRFVPLTSKAYLADKKGKIFVLDLH